MKPLFIAVAATFALVACGPSDNPKPAAPATGSSATPPAPATAPAPATPPAAGKKDEKK